MPNFHPQYSGCIVLKVYYDLVNSEFRIAFDFQMNVIRPISIYTISARSSTAFSRNNSLNQLSTDSFKTFFTILWTKDNMIFTVKYDVNCYYPLIYSKPSPVINYTSLC